MGSRLFWDMLLELVLHCGGGLRLGVFGGQSTERIYSFTTSGSRRNLKAIKISRPGIRMTLRQVAFHISKQSSFPSQGIL
jgi:hypothetical protein